jgi:hypothetical protein
VRSSELAIALGALGGVFEVAGVLTVVWEVAGDRKRAKALLSAPRNYQPPERRYPARLGNHSFGVGGYSGQGAVASTQRQSPDEAITSLAASTGNALLALRESLDKERDELQEVLLGEIDKGYNGVRADLKDVLESDVRIRLAGVAALLIGVGLSVAGSILGNVS